MSREVKSALAVIKKERSKLRKNSREHSASVTKKSVKKR